MGHLQKMIAILVGSNAHWERHNDGWRGVAEEVVKPHRPVIHITNLRQHSVEVNGLNEHPGEETLKGVVEEDGHQLAHRLVLHQIDTHSNAQEEDELRHEETENQVLVNWIGVGLKASHQRQNQESH